MRPAILPSRRRARLAAAAALLSAALSGCAHDAGAMSAAGLPPGEDPRCAAATNQGVALISEWSPAEKANLEQALRGGAVAVEHLGCRIRILTQCRVGGGYAWQRAGPAQSSVDIDGEQALFDRLPLSAAALQPDLRRAGKLRVTTQVAGELRLQQGAAAPLPPEGECQYATHVITSVTLGASVLSGGDGRMIRSAGDPQACSQATAAGPNPGCAVPLQLSLAPVPGRGPQEPPPGMAQVDVVSDSPEEAWDVYVGEDHVCTTPCTQWLDPMRPVFLRSQRRGDELWLPVLGPELMETRNGVLVATGHSRAKFAVGATFTTLGGMGMVVGIVFTAVGCSDLARRGGECTAGLITGGVSIPITAAFIWMLVDSNPKADVFPVLRTQPGRAQVPISVGLTPTGIAGTF